MMSDWDHLKPFGYQVICADPPWSFENYSTKGELKNPKSKYECMPTEEIAELPVNHLAAPNCALFLWATFPMLPDALCVMEAWGFRYASGAPWAKQTRNQDGFTFGTGYWFRSAAELLLLGTRGKPRPQSRRERNLIVAPRRQHSRKPDEAYSTIERLCAGPYCELFARERRAGWAGWGNEVGKFDSERST